MREARPSATALRVAMRRAAHQLTNSPPVFEDPLALRILGSEAAMKVRSGTFSDAASRQFGAFFAVRSRFAEDELKRAMKRGVRQYVVLGAGLDTFAYRNSQNENNLKMFEVDHPATQAWKREMLVEAGMQVPDALSFVAVDFDREELAGKLREAGFREDVPAFFSWLGVVPYLTEPAVDGTLGFIARMPANSAVAFDYGVPRESLGWMDKMVFDELARRVAKAGEPFRLFFDPQILAAKLRQLGFREIEDLGREEINGRYFSQRTDDLRLKGSLGRLLCARV